MEEKNAFATNISVVNDDNGNQADAEGKTKQEIIDVKSTINQLNVIIGDHTNQLEGLTDYWKWAIERDKWEIWEGY